MSNKDAARILSPEEMEMWEDIVEPFADINLDRTGQTNDMIGAGDIVESHEELRRRLAVLQPQKPADMALRSAYIGMVGYLEALKDAEGIQKGYVNRLFAHYLPRLADAIAAQQPSAPALDPDMPAQTLRLHMGELTQQDERTARAAIRWANSSRQPPQAKGEQDD